MEAQQLRGDEEITMNTLERNLKVKYPNDDLTVLVFTNVKSMTIIKCNSCDKEYSYAIAENSCKKRNNFCSCVELNNKRINYEKALQEKYLNENLELINYQGYDKQCLIKCLTCDNDYKMQFDSAMTRDKKVICKFCFPGKHSIFNAQKKDFLHWHKTMGNKQFSFPSNFNEIKLCSEKLFCKCKACDKTNAKTMTEYMKNIKCLCLCNNRLKTHEQFMKDLENKGILKNYTPLDSYNGVFNKIKVRHQCGFIWEITPHNLLLGKGCPKCNRFSSKGEKYINKILTENNIPFMTQSPLKINNTTLFLDFMIGDHIAIEYQGIQHYEPIEYFGGIERFNQQVYNDNLKKEYCETHNINLIHYNYQQSFDEIHSLLINLLKFNDYPVKEYAINY